jgi:hypothetical protein
MIRASCNLHIGVTEVRGTWEPGRFGGGVPRHASAYFQPQEANSLAGIKSALGDVLSKILPTRKLFLPRVTVSVDGTYFRALILPFAKLPASEKDRTLLISQRFCRESRLDPKTVTVLGSRLGVSKSGGEAVLCLALPNTLLSGIQESLQAHSLHADVIAPAYMLDFAQANTRPLEAPGLVLMRRGGSNTILVWDKDSTIVHIACQTEGPVSIEAERRTVSRIFRYAKIVGGGAPAVTVYLDGPLPETLAHEHNLEHYGLKLSPWPVPAGRLAGQRS